MHERSLGARHSAPLNMRLLVDGSSLISLGAGAPLGLKILVPKIRTGGLIGTKTRHEVQVLGC